MQEYDELFLPNGKVKKVKRSESTPRMIENFIDGHKIDYVKGRVAFDLEWNSKDQTFDRDLYALRTFHECGLISAGVMVTRSEKLNPVFDVVPQLNKAGEEIGKTVKAKYGASTTWMGKLLYRLNAGRHGGCPVVVIGITPNLLRTGTHDQAQGQHGIGRKGIHWPGMVVSASHTILADPPWQFQNRTGKMAPDTQTPVPPRHDDPRRHHDAAGGATGDRHGTPCLWVPNALLPEGIKVLEALGLLYKSNIVWHKVRKDGGPDGRGVGFYFRNVTELVLFGVRGKNARTLAPGRRQVNFLRHRSASTHANPMSSTT